MVPVLIQRLRDTRLQMLDVYGNPATRQAAGRR